jgi:hypothetical protein
LVEEKNMVICKKKLIKHFTPNKNIYYIQQTTIKRLRNGRGVRWKKKQLNVREKRFIYTMATTVVQKKSY